MITIDDAGWGCPVLGVCIAVAREETGEHYVGRIPTELFQRKFADREYLERAWQIVKEGLGSIKVKEEERIIICSGYILSFAAEELAREGRSVEIRSGIDFKSHEFAEKAFLDWLREVGAPRADLDRRGASFHELTKWVFEDREREKRFGKTGWKAWRKWRDYWRRRH
ncbi:MAG: hypothetical protein ACE5OY_07405 [Candidatus Bathyarchaeia archaeon]